jgi:ribosomal protein S9
VKCYGALSAWGLYLRRKVLSGRGVLRASAEVNGKGLMDYFYGEPSKVRSALAPVVEVLWFVGPRTRSFLSRCRFNVVARGGGLQGQADACCLGLAKALVEYFRRWDAVLRLTVCCWTHWMSRNTGHSGSLNVQKRLMEALSSRSLSGYLDCRDLKPILKERGMLRSDSRVKERKKFGLKGARRAPQYSKR